MDTKKWPILAQFLIGLGVVGGLMNIAGGLSQKNIINIVFGVIGLTIYWNFYKFKNWAFIGLNILLSLNVLLGLSGLLFLKGTLLLMCAITFIYSALVIIYFNRKKIKGLFNKTETGPASTPEGKI